jgi:uncharacterized protein YfbU (UPF0304 family)
MKLDIKDRLTLSYQLKILEKLYPEEKEYYANHRKAIEDGYELHYEWITEHLSTGLTTKECTFVLDVLNMYTDLHFFFLELKEPKTLTKKTVQFPGFDGSNETMFMAYTKYFIEDLNRFDIIKESTNGSYNSHSRMVTKYENMLKILNSIKNPHYENLTEEIVLEMIRVKAY